MQRMFFRFSNGSVLLLLLSDQQRFAQNMGGSSLDQVKDRHSVADRRQHGIAIGREDDVSLTIHRPTQVVEDKVCLHLGHYSSFVVPRMRL